MSKTVFFVFFSIAGHGMIVEGQPVIDHWGRRLMASAPENGTEEKNCSEPGMLFWYYSWPTHNHHQTAVFLSPTERFSVFWFIVLVLWPHVFFSLLSIIPVDSFLFLFLVNVVEHLEAKEPDISPRSSGSKNKMS